MPTPGEGESREDFVSRCIPVVLEDGTAGSQDQAVAICNSMWRQAKSKATVKAMDDGSLMVGGYGVIWGGKDLDGEYFTPSTDFWFDRITETPMVLYDHGLDGTIKRSVVGRVSAKQVNDVGLWLETQINKANAYRDAIVELAEQGKLGYSSGAVSHLVDVDRKTGEIKSWPVAEFSLTPTPCEPRTLGVAALRSLAEAEPAVKALMPEGDERAPAESVARRRGRAKALLLELELSMTEG